MTTIFPVVAAVPVFRVKTKPIGFPLASASAWLNGCGSLKNNCAQQPLLYFYRNIVTSLLFHLEKSNSTV
jgi:hypothetical protein